LNPDTPIYRFFDFAALVNTVERQKLRFAAVSQFLDRGDRNEGLEIHYNSLRKAIESKDGLYKGIRSREDALRLHKNLAGGFFVCSWTLAADSIALWSLYSADKSGVRISSRVSKLQAALDDFARKNGRPSALTRDQLDSALHYADWVGVRAIQYEDLRRMHEMIAGKGREHADEVLKDLAKKWHRLEPFTIKDTAYGHESEVRGIVKYGGYAPSNTKDASMGRPPWLDDDGSYLFMDIDLDFVESVAIDPRCPRDKRKIIEEFLRDHDLRLSASRAFGYLLDELDFVKSDTTPPADK